MVPGELLKQTSVRKGGAGAHPSELVQGAMSGAAGSPVPPTLQKGFFSDNAATRWPSAQSSCCRFYL